jgi:diacylglycerol kinase family enzyme
MVTRVLMLMNESAGTGWRSGFFAGLANELRLSMGQVEELEVEVVDGHRAARLAAGRFLGASAEQAAVIVGGGGGTLRAVVEGACDSGAGTLPAARRLRIAALRMGSGNVVARQFGVPSDPLHGIRDIAASLEAGRLAPCGVIRCRFGTAGGGEDVRHAVTMCGLGQLGRTPGDLARWHRALPTSRRLIASAIGIERMNSLEYVCSAGGRLIASAVFPPACERVEVTMGARHERFRLLAGAVMNFGVRTLPVNPHVGIEEPAAGVLLLPRAGRLRAWRLTRGDQLRITLLDRDSIEFFLDEDPERAYGHITLEVAGTVAFVPGSAYGAAA